MISLRGIVNLTIHYKVNLTL